MKKHILLTGATSGFGYMAVEKLLEQGHTVYAGAREIEGRNKKSADRLKEGGAIPIELDVTKQANIDTAFESIDKLDVLINNAGVVQMGPAEAFTSEQFRQVFEVNVLGIHAMNRAALPLLRDSRDALIIYTSSVLGRLVLPSLAIYNASKWAVEGFAESYSYEIAGMGIESALVQPGAMATDIFEKMIKPKDASRLGYYGQFGEIGESLMGSIGRLMEGDNGNNPLDVAQAYVDLVNMPKGERPFRTPVGRDGVLVEKLNAESSVSQGEAMDLYGLGETKSG